MRGQRLKKREFRSVIQRLADEACAERESGERERRRYAQLQILLSLTTAHADILGERDQSKLAAKGDCSGFQELGSAAKSALGAQLQDSLGSQAVVAWSQMERSAPLLLRLAEVSDLAALRAVHSRGRPVEKAAAFGLALPVHGFDQQLAQIQAVQAGALGVQVPAFIRRGVQSIFELLAAADLRALQAWASARKAKMVDSCDCVRFQSTTSGRFDAAAGDAIQRASTSKEVGALLRVDVHAPAERLLPDRVIEKLVDSSRCKVKNPAKLWLQAHWGDRLCQLVHCLCASAVKAGRAEVTVCDVIEMVRREAMIHSGYAGLGVA